MKTVPSPIVAGRGVNKATTFTVVSPKPVPAIPPRLERINDSIRNCVDISSLLAPNAFLRPISSVLYLTDTSMIFIMPIPPTNNEIPPIAASINVKPPVIVETICKASF